MTPEQWQHAKALFQSALEREPNERAAFLDAACAGNAVLRNELDSLIEFDEGGGSFIERPAFEVAADLIADLPCEPVAGTYIGPYKVLREIGHGGMGAVYLAARADEQYRKEVAIKVVKPGLETGHIRRRFQHERQILANLDHPHIAKLLEGGTMENGLPYFVMDYVDGLPINVYCDTHRHSTIERLELFRKVCSAVHYAHQNLIIHRDLKPSNILITDQGVPKLLDFGIAKLLNPDPLQTIEHTATELRIMTPEYASPEQVRGEQVTTTTDVYSLGVLLYELLSGRRPYRITSRRPDQIARVICEVEPEKPSTAATRRHGDTETRGQAIPQSEIRNPKLLQGDLDNIVLMAMRKDPARRYSSVEQFSEDIRRHLEGLPVIARKDTFAYRGAKFVRRNRIGVAAAALVLLTLVGGVVATAWQARVARKQRDVARLETAKAERINIFLQDTLGFANPGWYSPNAQKGGDVTIGQILEDVGPRIESELADQPEVRAEMERTIGTTYMYRARYDLAERYLQSALETYLKLYGEEHSDTARTLLFLAEVRYFKGDLANAGQLQQKALVTYRKEQREGSVEPRWLAAALSDSGLVAFAKGDLKSAEALVREGLLLADGLRGNDRAVAALMRGLLGAIVMEEGNLDEAERLLRAAISEFRQLPGRARPEMGSSLTSLGEVLTYKGQLNEAESFLREAEALHRRSFGDNSPYVAKELMVQGYISYLKNDYAAAEEKVKSALEILKKIYPEAAPVHAQYWRLLGKIMSRTGRATQGEPLLRRTLDVQTGILPKGHWQIAFTKSALGECLTAQKRYSEAEPLFLESYNTFKAKLSEQDLRLKQASLLLAELYDAWGKPNEALRYR